MITNATATLLISELKEFLQKLLFALGNGLCRGVGFLADTFEIVCDSDTLWLDCPTGKAGKALFRIFFGNTNINIVYWSLALLGIATCLGFTMAAAPKQTHANGGRKKRSTGDLLKNCIRGVTLIFLMNFILSSTATITSCLSDRVRYRMLNANTDSQGQSYYKTFDSEDYAAMARCLNTIENYSLNDSCNSCFNLNSCYNDMREDLCRLAEKGVFDVTYVTTEYDEAGNSCRVNTWQSVLQSIYLSVNDVTADRPMDASDAGLSEALLQAMEIIRNDASFTALDQYYVTRSGQAVVESAPLERLVMLLGSMYGSDGSLAKGSGFTDYLRQPYITGRKDIFDYGTCSRDFDMSLGTWMYLVVILTAFLCGKELLLLAYHAVARILCLLRLYLLDTPLVPSTRPDHGEKQKQWVRECMIQGLALCGTIVLLRLAMLFPVMLSQDSIQVFQSERANVFVGTLLLCVILFLTRKASGSLVGLMESGIRRWAAFIGRIMNRNLRVPTAAAILVLLAVAAGLAVRGEKTASTTEDSAVIIAGGNGISSAQELSSGNIGTGFGGLAGHCAYQVTVQVADSSTEHGENGDCGSGAPFYFQLVFRDEAGSLHSSSVVLPDRLCSDGFRTGSEESFFIYTNDDYGVPVQIVILPDNTSSVRDSFDALCIDSLSVSRTDETGVSRNWISGEIGWIGGEIQSFSLQEDGYTVKLEFGIETAVDDSNETHFVGQVLADITYRDDAGVLHIATDIDVVSSMADYADCGMVLADGTDSDTSVSLPEFMFRKGTINRFQVELKNICSLVDIRFRIVPAHAGDGWSIARVFARQVCGEGTPETNIMGEIQRIYDTEPRDLAATDNEESLIISTTISGGSGTLNFGAGNAIFVDWAQQEETVKVQQGASEGVADAVSVTVSLGDSTGIAANATLPVRIMYRNIYGDAYRVDADLVFDRTTGKFYIPSDSLVGTPDLGIPYQVEVTGGTVSAGRELEAVTVYQLREGKVIHQFLFAPAAGTLLETVNPVVIRLSESLTEEYAGQKGYDSATQMIYLKLGDETQKTLLTDIQDLQIALVYTEKDDPNAFEHISSFVSAMDCGYTVLESGMVLKIPMSVKNIGTVKSLRLQTTGSAMRVYVEKGCISIEETDSTSGARKFTGWANLPSRTELISCEGGTDMSTDGASTVAALTNTTRVSPLCMTAKFSTIKRSDSMVKITLHYVDNRNAEATLSCEKTAAEWNQGEYWFLLNGVKSIQDYAVEVYDKDASNLAGVTLSSLTFGWYSSSGEYTTTTITGDLVLTEGIPMNSLLMTTELTGTAAISSDAAIQQAENLLEDTDGTADGTVPDHPE